MANTPTAAPGVARRRIRKAIIAIVICCILAAALIMTIYVFHAPQVFQAAAAVVAAGLGAFVLHWAFPAEVIALATTIAATVAVVGLILLPPQTVVRIVQWPIPIVPGLTNPKIVYAPPAKCPGTLDPMALVQTEYPVPNSHPTSTNGLGAAHIDNVIAPDGSANVRKFETVCLTVQKYPAADRQLWLILRLREPGENGSFYNLYFVVSALTDPFAGRYSVAVDRSCSSLSKGDRHTLFVISAPTSAATGLWQNYNAWLHSLNTAGAAHCNTKADIDRHRLPLGYYIASEQGDVIQS